MILTTHGGLYRYRLGDIVEVAGHLGSCPLLSFVEREGGTVDLVGEKLGESHVSATVAKVLKRHDLRPGFWLVAPERGREGAIFYTLFLQLASSGAPAAVLQAVASELEEGLQDNCGYRYARSLGPLSLFWVTPEADAHSEYLNRCVALGQRLGNIKLTHLHSQAGWSQVFPGRFLTPLP